MINRGFDWDTVQMPINVLDHHFLSFSQRVLPVAVEKGIGVIGMKSLAGGAIPGDNLVPVKDCLRFAMTLPISTLCSGMDSIKVLRENIATARDFVPMTEDEMAELLERTLPLARDGQYEEYKTYEPDPDDDW
jgi:predicted aldo/keto reductase-like oxidoreductase